MFAALKISPDEQIKTKKRAQEREKKKYETEIQRKEKEIESLKNLLQKLIIQSPTKTKTIAMKIAQFENDIKSNHARIQDINAFLNTTETLKTVQTRTDLAKTTDALTTSVLARSKTETLRTLHERSEKQKYDLEVAQEHLDQIFEADPETEDESASRVKELLDNAREKALLDIDLLPTPPSSIPSSSIPSAFPTSHSFI